MSRAVQLSKHSVVRIIGDDAFIYNLFTDETQIISSPVHLIILVLHTNNRSLAREELVNLVGLDTEELDFHLEQLFASGIIQFG